MNVPNKNSQSHSPHTITGVLSLVIVFWLASLQSVVSLFSSLSQPLVLGLLRLTSSGVSINQDVIYYGSVEVPWTRDCAGMNLLLVLLAITVWMNRHESSRIRFWTKLALMIPAAVVANTARVLTLIAYRLWMYPTIESPQLHYFFGFLWLVPVSMLAIPKSNRSRFGMSLELFHTATVISLLTPLMNTRGGWGLAAAVILGLANCRFPVSFSKTRILFLYLWLLVAFPIAWVGIESLWLPWVMICPLVANATWLKSSAGFLVTLASCPIVHLTPVGQAVAWLIIAFAVWNYFSDAFAHKVSEENARLDASTNQAFLGAPALAFLLPFLASVIFTANQSDAEPPSTLESRTIKGMGYELRLPNQPSGLSLLWYTPQGSDRHHALETCLQYRGIKLEKTAYQSVQTDGEHWFREFFLVEGELIDTHLEYLKRTLGFRRSPGVHLIVVSPKRLLSPTQFDLAANLVTGELMDELEP
ncbi:MAG: exosortase/archaeosortase family protein [Verrucomicrobiota bacterium]